MGYIAGPANVQSNPVILERRYTKMRQLGNLGVVCRQDVTNVCQTKSEAQKGKHNQVTTVGNECN